MTFNAGYRQKVVHFVANEHVNLMHTIEDKITRLFRAHPARTEFSKQTIIDEILKDEELKRFWN